MMQTQNTESRIRAPIPVFVMSYNDLPSLRLCLRALTRRTRLPISITVVDNSSTDLRLQSYLGKLAALTGIKVWRNRFNLWVLGLNKVIREWARTSDDDSLFAVTDCDIVVPPVRNGQCWLTRMEFMLSQNACVGKLGLSLDLGYIKSREAFRHTYERERFFMQGPRIGDMVVAPVDTTMALMRKSAFVTRLPLFIPPHQSLYRPHLYCCRTSENFQARHLSWRFYSSRSTEDIVAKLICYGVVGATAVPAAYMSAPLSARLFYLCFKPVARLFWGCFVVVLHIAYLARHFPRRLNPLQASRRA